MGKCRVFQDWVDTTKGKRWLADKIGVSIHTVYFWYERRGSPKASTMAALVKLSKGVLSFESIMASTRK